MTFSVGDIIRDVEDGDCYFEGQVTEIEKNEVTKYRLLKIVWSGEEDKDCIDLNTIIEPRWWYITKR
jgi:hypothetical protein